MVGVILDLIFPPRCVGCGLSGALVCEDCWEAFIPLGPQVCPVCGTPIAAKRHCQLDSTHFRWARSAFLFEGPCREAIHALKYKRRAPLARVLVEGMITNLHLPDRDFEALVPVPLHSTRLSERGFNQTAVLAEALSAWWHIPVWSEALTRIRSTRSQIDLGLEDRLTNVSDAFRGNAKIVTGRSVMLVDDVFTTGATLGSCALALRQAGAGDVVAVTLARAH